MEMMEVRFKKVSLEDLGKAFSEELVVEGETSEEVVENYLREAAAPLRYFGIYYRKEEKEIIISPFLDLRRALSAVELASEYLERAAGENYLPPEKREDLDNLAREKGVNTGEYSYFSYYLYFMVGVGDDDSFDYYGSYVGAILEALISLEEKEG